MARGVGSVTCERRLGSRINRTAWRGNMLIGVVKSYAHVSGLVDLYRTMRKNSFGGE